ncbi:MAG: SdpI family protein [Candidatus Micrarchaeota archaeon]
MRKYEVAVLASIALLFLIGAYIYPAMPEEVASHWNAQGQANDYMPKFWGVFFVPLLSVFLAAIFLAIPRIDPLKKNIEQFRDEYEKFILIFFVFFIYVYLLTISWNLGYKFDMMVAINPGLAAIFFFSGSLMEKAKMNWFIGIRTPWTMSSERVWTKTHKIGGKLFKACGVISLAGILAGQYAVYFILVPILLVTAYLFIYSYLEFQKEQKEKGKKLKKR